jgi:hypothetical protein
MGTVDQEHNAEHLVLEDLPPERLDVLRAQALCAVLTGDTAPSAVEAALLEEERGIALPTKGDASTEGRC